MRYKMKAVFVLLLLFIGGAVCSFPKQIKVQINYPEPAEVEVYKAFPNEFVVADAEIFFEGKLTTLISPQERNTLTAIIIRYNDTTLNESIKINTVQIALGNYLFYNGSLDMSGLYVYHDIALGPDGEQKVTGIDPYIMILNPESILAEQVRHLQIKHGMLWLFLFMICAGVFFTFFSQLKGVCWRAFSGIKKNIKPLMASLTVVLIGIVLGFLLGTINDIWNPNGELQKIEVIFWGGGAGALGALIYQRTHSVKYTFIAGVFCSICLLMTAKGLTTFLTADERMDIMEQAKLFEDELRHWEMGSTWSNYALMGTFWNIFKWEWLEEVTGLNYKQIGKIVHWAFGILGMLFAGDLVQRRILNKERKCTDFQIACNYCVIYGVTLLVPAVTMSLKSYNYDMFSTVFGAIGAIYVFIAIRDKNIEDAIKAIIFSFLGVIEKKTVVPVLLMASAILPYITLVNEKNLCIKWIKAYALSVIEVLGIWGMVYTISTYVCGFLKAGYSPIITLHWITDVTFNKFEPFTQVFRGLFPTELGRYGITGMGIATVLLFGGGVLYEIHLLVNKPTNNKIGERICEVLIWLFLVTGMTAAYIGIEFTENKVRYLFYILQNYMMAIPSALLFLLIVGLIGKNAKERLNLLIALVIVTWGVVPCYIMELRWNPTWVRYLDVFLYIFSLMAICIGLPVIYEKASRKNIVLCIFGILGILQVSEVRESMPGFTYFAPYWYTATALQKNREDREMVVYWGENRESLGREILNYCKENDLSEQPIKIYYGYIRGDWLTKPDYVEIADKEWNADYTQCGTTKYDFYALDTQGIRRGMVKDGWPEGVVPIREITYRGYVIARIYQGTQLKAYFGKEQM